MMTESVLALDASTEGCSVALTLNGQRYSRQHNIARTHAQSLLPMIDEVLVEAGITLNQLDYIALVNGPGSFTGLRIAVSVAQGLAFGANLPVVCVPSLQSLAQQTLLKLNASTTVVCALDARMKEVYWAAYQLNTQGDGVVVCCKPCASSYEDFNTAVCALKSDGCALLGVGSGFSVDEIKADEFEFVDAALEPSALAVIDILNADPHLLNTKQSAAQIEPLYLRNEVAWKKRKKIRTPQP